jgi:hypothetical protein
MVSQGRPEANFSVLCSYIKEDLDVREGKDKEKAENWMKNNVFCTSQQMLSHNLECKVHYIDCILVGGGA